MKLSLRKLHITPKTNKIVLGLSGLMVGALTFGITATSSAWGYGGYGGYGGGYGGWGTNNNTVVVVNNNNAGWGGWGPGWGGGNWIDP